MDSATGESTSAQPCVHFSLADIQSATNNFDDKMVIGRGGFGKVYKGCFHTNETSQIVAVKWLDPRSQQGAQEFWAEIEIVSKLRHRHLVPLIGFCDYNEEMVLVFEYIPLGTLYEHLHIAYTPLSWVERVNIALGAARGLDYLHTGTQHGVIHRDVKSSNILIDENWAAMISDFGLSKIGPTNQSISYVDARVKGTLEYLDPEYFYTSKLTRKTDVYALRVVYFELLSGRLAVDERNADEQYSLVRWARKCVKERKLSQLVDSNIKGTIFPRCLRRFAQIAYCCVHSDPKERPTMTEVVASLHALLELQERSNRSAELSGIRGFSWKIHKYFVPAITKPNSGRYGMVYKGLVDNTELPIAVKKLYCCALCDLEVLNSFRHPNLVKLIGYCLEGYRLFLVYEFMHKGNLEDLLHSGALARLPLVTKVKIVVEIAQGIIFLQNTLSNITQPRVSESPLYRHKILLDEDFGAKLLDYDVTLLVDGQYSMAYPDDDGMELVLESNLSGYEVVFMEVLSGERIYNLNRALSIDLFFRQCGKLSLRRIAQLCFKICNEVDSKTKMLRILKEHDELIQRRLKSWLLDQQS